MDSRQGSCRWARGDRWACFAMSFKGPYIVNTRVTQHLTATAAAWVRGGGEAPLRIADRGACQACSFGAPPPILVLQRPYLCQRGCALGPAGYDKPAGVALCWCGTLLTWHAPSCPPACLLHGAGGLPEGAPPDAGGDRSHPPVR